MWRNAVLYSASSGGQCGIYLRELTAGRGQLILFFDQNASEQTRYQFEEYVLQHLERRALAGTVEVHRASVCRKCGTAVPEVYAAGRLSQGFAWIECAVCSTRVLLTELKQALTQPDTTGVARLEDAADAARAYDVWLTSAGAEVLTSSFTNWVGASDATLAIVFTDVVGSTTLANDLGSERMYEVWAAHAVQTRNLLEKYQGREVKTMGDGFLVAFRTAIEALDFALALYVDTGHEQVAIRVGIHIGPLRILDGDIFGTTLNFAARVLSMATGAEIWLSERVKEDIEQQNATRHRQLEWLRHNDCLLKGFPDTYTLWSVQTPQMRRLADPSRHTDTPAAALQHKLATGQYDIFLCYNSADRAAVQQIAERLKQHGILPWFDVWELRPGETWQESLARQIKHIKATAVFIGADGVGPWQNAELEAFIGQFVAHRCPVMPVILPGHTGEPHLPALLKGLRAVDFRWPEPNPLAQLVRGITGVQNH
jgi:class 3 adenylate cyclase